MERSFQAKEIAGRLAWVGALVLLFCLPVSGHAIEQKAVVSTSDWTTTAVSVIDVDSRAGTVDHAPLASDEHVTSYGNFFYRIGRFNNDWVAKFHVTDPDTPIYQYSVLDTPGGATGNPHDLVFVNENKAYLIFYEKAVIWIVNPSATSAANFKIGQIAIDAAYSTGDGLPDSHTGVIVNGKLFVLMQNYNQTTWSISGPGYVAVYDVATDTEINVSGGSPKGITLNNCYNPTNIVYSPDTGLLYVSGPGDRFETPDTTSPSGVVSINPTTYAVTLMIDDTNAGYQGTGTVESVGVAGATKSYFISGGYDGWWNPLPYTVTPFHTGTYAQGTALAGFTGKTMAIDYDSIGIDKNGYVWFLNRTDNQAGLVNSATDAVDHTASVGSLPPQHVVFCPHDTTDADGDGIPAFEDSDDGDATKGAFQAASGQGEVTIQTDAGVFEDFEAKSDNAGGVNQTGKPDGYEFKYGLWSYRITGLANGQTVNVTLTFPSSLSSSAVVYKIDGTGFYAFENAVIAGNTLTMVLQDGGEGDADGTANGIIVDPAGIAVPGSGGAGAGSGGGGCFIGTLD